MAQESKNDNRKAKSENHNPYEALQQELSAATGWKIKIQDGKVSIAFADEQELNKIVDKLR